MSNVKISDLPAIITQLSADLYETSSAGTSYKESRQQVLDYVRQNISAADVADTSMGTVVLTNPLSNAYTLTGNNGSNIVRLPVSNNALSGYPLGIPLFFINLTSNTYIIEDSASTELATIGRNSSAILVLLDRNTPQGNWEVVSSGGGEGSGDLLAVNNLSDVENYYTSSQNLGVNSGYFESLGNTGNFSFPARFTNANISSNGTIPVATLPAISNSSSSIQVGENIYISNVGTLPIDIWTNSGVIGGTFICEIPADCSIILALKNNSTSEGTWTFNSVNYRLPYENALGNTADFGIPNFGMAQIGATVPGLRCFLPAITPGGDPLITMLAGTNSLIQNIQSEDIQIVTNSGSNIVLLAAGDSVILSLTDGSTSDGAWAYTYIDNSTTGNFTAVLDGAGSSSSFTVQYQVVERMVTLTLPNIATEITDNTGTIPLILTATPGAIPDIIKPSSTSITTALCCTNPGSGFINTLGICVIPTSGEMEISPSLVPISDGGTPWNFGIVEGLSLSSGSNITTITYSK